MKARLNLFTTDPDAIKAVLGLQTYVDGCGLEHALLELVKIRASQINGCAFCLDMHVRDARRHGETEQRVYLLDAWEESPVYSDRERAALAWTESLTRLSETHVPDDVYEQVRTQFSEKELVDLTVAIGVINTWNRLNAGFRTPPQLEIHAAAS
ncbi:carboxymuconolactone decarboxylase family protein [Emcibacter sp. SYSU 3D8]|uniref:carboxymuconolactone decarboxylase family protein n=1 Tax=Emcibacter sp. SYSU 3D8 TaxID=3133969 RepID=UPI0031FEB810